MSQNPIEGPFASIVGGTGSEAESGTNLVIRAIRLHEKKVSKIQEGRAKKRWQCTNPFCKHHNPMEMLTGSEVDRSKRGAVRCSRCESIVITAIKDGVPVSLHPAPSSTRPLDTNVTVQRIG
jgi:hypothetical protein